MDINLIRVVFLLIALSTAFLGLLINYAESYLPVLITRTYRYGKFAVNIHQSLVVKAEVPKRWFKHYYIFSTPLSTSVMFLILYTYCYHGIVPEVVYRILDVLFGVARQPLVSAENTIIASVLLTIQCWKRLYETCHVNVFSNKKINILHYLIGFVHYFGAIASIIGESKGFVRGFEGMFDWHRISVSNYFCINLFLWSSYAQLNANFILAKLRKDSNGNVIYSGYRIPSGKLFEYISSPLQFTEILMYVALSIILWESSTFHYITLWVLVNQVETGLLTHWWYHQTFKNYPKTRKAVVPYCF